MGIQVVVFDFDGVFVLDSDAVFKKEAWGIALKRWAGKYEAFLEEGGQLYASGKSGGRAEILRYVLERLEPAETIPSLVKEAARVFDEHVQARILNAGLVRGARELLETLSNRDIRLYLNSGTATSALQRTARNIKIDQFFSGILGSTKEPCGGSKTDNLRYIAEREGVGANTLLFVGDSESDYRAALEFGCKFVGIANKWNQWAEKEKPFRVIADLSEITGLVDRSPC